MENNKDNQDNQYKTLMIPVIVVNGIVSGVISVITSYFFKPLWNRAVTWWNDQYK